MSATGRLGLPYLFSAQAKKEITHNEALARLDAFVTPVVRDLVNTPPTSANDGDLYLVDEAPTGVFQSKSHHIAQYQAGAWVFYSPFKWMDAVVERLNTRLAYDGTRWVPFGLIMSDTGEYLRVGHDQEDVPVISGSYRQTTMVIPNRAIVLCVNVRVLTAVSGTSAFHVGISGETQKFGGFIGAGKDSTNIGVIGPTAFYANTPIRLTANGGSFTGGLVRTTIQYLKPKGPWSWE